MVIAMHDEKRNDWLRRTFMHEAYKVNHTWQRSAEYQRYSVAPRPYHPHPESVAPRPSPATPNTDQSLDTIGGGEREESEGGEEGESGSSDEEYQPLLTMSPIVRVVPRATRGTRPSGVACFHFFRCLGSHTSTP